MFLCGLVNVPINRWSSQNLVVKVRQKDKSWYKGRILYRIFIDSSLFSVFMHEISAWFNPGRELLVYRRRLSLDPVFAITFAHHLHIRVSANWAPDPTVFCIGEKTSLRCFLLFQMIFSFQKVFARVHAHTHKLLCLFCSPLSLSIGLAEMRDPYKLVLKNMMRLLDLYFALQ